MSPMIDNPAARKTADQARDDRQVLAAALVLMLHLVRFLRDLASPPSSESARYFGVSASDTGALAISDTTALVRQSAAMNSAPRPCRAARQARPAASTEVTSIDAAGRACLAGMHCQGAEFIAADCLMKAVVVEITGAPVPDPDLPP